MKILNFAGKVILAGILSVIILSFLMCFYSLTPVHLDNPKGNTDYVWPADSVWVMAAEGIAWGKFDANGFNNLSVIENPDVIVLGSSHMEAREIMQDQTAAYLLGQKLQGDYSVYNMGISGHNLFKVCQYIPANLDLFEKTPKVTIIETSTVNLQRESVDQVLSGTVARTESHSTGLISILQKIPFFRVIYHQIEAGLIELFMPSPSRSSAAEVLAAEEKPVVSKSKGDTVDQDAYADLFSYLAGIEERYATQIIIFYHPTGSINADGTIEFMRSEQLTAFSQYADAYGINFIDMTSAFEDMYLNEHHVAHGFVTGELETGHLNAYGHAAAADALYAEIQKMEEVGELCQ